MSGPKNEGRAEGFLADCARIYREWHERAQAVDTEGLLALYHKEAVLESPLVQAILDDKPDGVLRAFVARNDALEVSVTSRKPCHLAPNSPIADWSNQRHCRARPSMLAQWNVW